MDSLPKTYHSLPIAVYTDGSCDHRDGIAGYAAIVCDRHQGSMIYRGGMETGSSVRRAEIQGLLIGLQTALELSGLHDPKIRAAVARSNERRQRIDWYTDRADIAYAVTPELPGQALYSRDTDADLWHRVAFYEGWFDITAHRVPRNTIGAQSEADRVSGILRKLLQEKTRELRDDSKVILQ